MRAKEAKDGFGSFLMSHWQGWDSRLLSNNAVNATLNQLHSALQAPPRRGCSSPLLLVATPAVLWRWVWHKRRYLQLRRDHSADILPPCPHFWNAFTQLALWIWRALCRPPQATEDMLVTRFKEQTLRVHLERERKKKEKKNPPPQPSSTTPTELWGFKPDSLIDAGRLKFTGDRDTLV